MWNHGWRCARSMASSVFDSLYFSQKPIDIALNEPECHQNIYPPFFTLAIQIKNNYCSKKTRRANSKLNKKGHKELYQSRIGVRALFYVPERKTIFMMHMLILKL